MNEEQINKIFELIHDKHNIKMLVITSEKITLRWHDNTLKRFDSNFNGVMEAINWIEYAKAEEEVISKEFDVREVFYP